MEIDSYKIAGNCNEDCQDGERIAGALLIRREGALFHR